MLLERLDMGESQMSELITCFVIQRFDGGTYDRRYRETIAPAIENGGAKPVRADEVLGTTPVIDKIESSIQRSTIAFADISEDNGNVFLELGYALALNIPLVMVCDRSKRDKLPFDVSHRPVIFYNTEAQSDFEKLADNIEKNVRAAIEERRQRKTFAPAMPESESEWERLENACLLELLDQDLRSGQSGIWYLQRQIMGDGVSERMVALAVSNLVEKSLVATSQSFDENNEPYVMITLTPEGRNYLLRSYSTLMQEEKDRIALRPSKKSPRPAASFDSDLDDDVPF
jgi:hypothetical protein